jgi:hypothetical protein
MLLDILLSYAPSTYSANALRLSCWKRSALLVRSGAITSASSAIALHDAKCRSPAGANEQSAIAYSSIRHCPKAKLFVAKTHY